MTTTRRAFTQGLLGAASLAPAPLLAQNRTVSTSSSGTVDLAPRAIWPGGVQKPLMPYTPAIKAGGWLFVAGQLASDFKTGIDPAARSNDPAHAVRLGLQSKLVLSNLAETVAAAGLDMSKDTARIWQWYTSPHPTPAAFKRGDTSPQISAAPHLAERDRVFKQPLPASTGIGIKELMVKDTLLEIELIGVEDGGANVGFPALSSQSSALGGRSSAVRRGDWVFLAADPAGPAGTASGNLREQAEATLAKLARMAEVAGSSLGRAVKAEVFIGDPSGFAEVDAAWAKWFPKNPPARIVVPYSGLGSKGSRVEIALTLLANDSNKRIETVLTGKAPKPIGHAPQAVKAGNLLFLSQQLPVDENGKVPENLVRHPSFPYYGQPARQQMNYMLKNVAAICEAAGTSLSNVVRRACFHDHGVNFAESMDEWAAHFPQLKPVSTTIILGGPLQAAGAHTLLDIIAYAP